MAVEIQIGRGQEVIVEGERMKLRPGLVIIGEPENGENKYGRGVRKEENGTVVQDGQWWMSWATPPIQYSAEAAILDPTARGAIRDITPLYGIPLFSPPSKRFG